MADIWQFWGDEQWNRAEADWPSSPSYIAEGNLDTSSGDGPDGRRRTSWPTASGTWDTASDKRRSFDLASLDDSPETLVMGCWWQAGGSVNAGSSFMAAQAADDQLIRMGTSSSGGAGPVRIILTPDTDTWSNDTDLLVTDNDIDTSEWTFYEVVLTRADGDLTIDVWTDGIFRDTTTITDPLVGDWVHAGFSGLTGGGSAHSFRWKHGGYVGPERLGPCYVDTARPDTQGTHDEWTPSNSPGNINNDTANTDSIEGSDDERTTYDMTSMDLAVGIFGIQVAAICSGDPARGFVRNGGTDSEMAELPAEAGTAVYRFTSPITIDPTTSEPWDADDIAAAEFGLIGGTGA